MEGEMLAKSEVMTGKDQHTIPASEGTRQVLVVDDDKAIQKILSRTFSFMGYDVTLAGNGLEASTLFLTGSYDLVMTDFQMPLMNGWELSRIVKEQSPNTPVIIVTGFCDDKLWENLNMNCVDAIIPKPFKLKEIEKIVRRLLKSGT
jgi:two-component system copper resistance phosphate regulon response regulator CusR